MALPREITDKFNIESLHKSLRALSPEDAFQQLVSRLYQHQFENVKTFPTKGKDGCIDIFWLDVNSNKHVAVECKHTEKSGDARTLLTIWDSVEKNLGKNLL